MNQPAAEPDEIVVIALDLEVECSPRFGDAFDRDDRLPFAGAVFEQIARLQRLRRDPLAVIRRPVVCGGCSLRIHHRLVVLAEPLVLSEIWVPRHGVKKDSVAEVHNCVLEFRRCRVNDLIRR